MDRALDEVIGERQRNERGSGRGDRGDRGDRGRGRRRNDWPRDGARKNGRDNGANIDDDWIHDKYDQEDDRDGKARGPRRPNRSNRDRDSPEKDLMDQGAKLRVENLHYDLTENDLEDLFNRISPVTTLTLTYDRAGRSTGTAYVSYRSINSARTAIREFDGANANGQPIRLSLVPSAPSRPARNPFDSAIKPAKSLFDRVEEGRGQRSGGASRGRDRSRSPRRSDTTKPAPDGIDRYVPGDRSRSPPRRRRGDGGGGRTDNRRGDAGSRRGGGAGDGGGRREEGGRQTGHGRPRKTQEELDQEMDAYWGSKAQSNGEGAGDGGAATSTTAAGVQEGDIDMAE